MLRSASLAIVQRIQLLFSILNLFDSIFPGIVLIDKLHNFEEGICFPDSGCHGKRKKQFFTYHSNRCYEQRMLHQKLESYRFTLPLKKLGWLDQCKVKQNTTTSKMCILRKRMSKIKTYNNFTFHVNLLQFCS